LSVAHGRKRHAEALPLAKKTPRALLSVRAGTKQELCQVSGSMRCDAPSVHGPRPRRLCGQEGWGRLGKGVGRPLADSAGRAPRYSQFSLARRPQSPREANSGPPPSPLTARERGRPAPGSGGQPQPPTPSDRPEIGSSPPLSLRKPGPSPGGEAVGAGAARCPQINALSCLQRICAFKTSSQGLPRVWFGLHFHLPLLPPSVHPSPRPKSSRLPRLFHTKRSRRASPGLAGSQR